LADKKVVDLERLATALYVTKEKSGQDVEARARRIHELKPHVSVEDAKKAVKTVDEMIREVTQGLEGALRM
jgi:predicted ATP-dependent serine protease